MPEPSRELDRRIRDAIDGIPAPDLWSEVGAPGHPGDERAPRWSSTRIAALAVGIVVTLFSILGLLSLRPESAVPSTPSQGKGRMLSTTAIVRHMPGVRCTASVPAVVQPGAPIAITYDLKNISDRPVSPSIDPRSFRVQVRDGDGTSWNTLALMDWLGGHPTQDRPLQPGEVQIIGPTPLVQLYVQFPGPLSVTPICESTRLEPVQVRVDAGQGTVPASQAIDVAAASSASLLNNCMPQAGSEAVGTINAPANFNMPPLEAACSAEVASYKGFSVVTFITRTPSDMEPVQLPSGLRAFGWLKLPHGAQEVVVWRFVVPVGGSAIPVASGINVRAIPGYQQGQENEFEVSPSGWSLSGGGVCSIQTGGGLSGGTAQVFFFDCHKGPSPLA